MGNISKELNRMSLFGEWILASIAVSEDLGMVTPVHSAHLEFEELTLGGGFDQGALELETCADIGFGNLLITLYIFCYHYLKYN